MTADRNLIMSREIEAAPVQYPFRFVVAVGDFARAARKTGAACTTPSRSPCTNRAPSEGALSKRSMLATLAYRSARRKVLVPGDVGHFVVPSFRNKLCTLLSMVALCRYQTLEGCDRHCAVPASVAPGAGYLAVNEEGAWP